MLDWLKLGVQLAYDRSARKRVTGLRPTIMCITQSVSDQNRFIFIRPAADPSVWMPPQEGIEFGESMEQAALRCLDIELGLKEDQVQFRKSAFIADRLMPHRSGDRDIQYSVLPMRGKSYFAAYVKVDESAAIERNSAEVAEHAWIDSAEAVARLASHRQEKIKIIAAAFECLLGKPILADLVA